MQAVRFRTSQLYLVLGLVLVASFSVLVSVGRRVKDNAPPIPAHVVTSLGEVVVVERDLAA